MKQFYLLLVILGSHLTFAQEKALFGNDWYLNKLIINGKVYFSPSNDEVPFIKLEFNQEQKSLNTNVCNECFGGNINFSADKNDFTVNYFAVTLIECNNGTNSNYEVLYFPFFTMNTDPGIFSYTISEADDEKTLTITSKNDQAIYTTQKLATKNFKNSLFSISPNPAKDYICISFKDKTSAIAKVNLYDSLGKLCVSQKLDSQDKTINIQDLKKGLYFIKIETQNSIETQKIIIQ